MQFLERGDSGSKFVGIGFREADSLLVKLHLAHVHHIVSAVDQQVYLHPIIFAAAFHDQGRLG